MQWFCPVCKNTNVCSTSLFLFEFGLFQLKYSFIIDEEIDGDDNVDEMEEMGKLELDNDEDSYGSGEETEQTIQDRDLVEEDNDDEHKETPDEVPDNSGNKDFSI